MGGGRRWGRVSTPLCSLHHIHHYIYVTRPGPRPGNGRTGSICDEPRGQRRVREYVRARQRTAGGAVVLCRSCVRSIKYTKLNCPRRPPWPRPRDPHQNDYPHHRVVVLKYPVSLRNNDCGPAFDCVSGPRMRTIPTIPKTLCMACGQPSHLRTNLHTVTECMVMNFERHGDLRPGLTGRPNPQGRPSCAVPGGHVTWHAARHAATRKR